jgi:phage shock protein A
MALTDSLAASREAAEQELQTMRRRIERLEAELEEARRELERLKAVDLRPRPGSPR